MPRPTIGLVGIGTIGGAIGDRLSSAGYAVVGYDRDDDRLAAFAAGGGEPADGVAAVAAAADIVLTSLPTPAAARSVYLGDDGIAAAEAAPIAIDLSTVGPDTSTAIASTLPADRFLEAPISGGVEMARAGTLTLMVGGPEALVERESVAELLATIAADVVHTGPVGAGQTVKLVHNQIAIGTRLVFLEAAGVALRQGVDWDALLEVVSSPASMAASRVFEVVMPMVLDREFDPGFSVELSRKDMGLVLELADESGAPVFLASLVYQLHRQAEARDLGDRNVSAMIELFEEGADGRVAWSDG